MCTRTSASGWRGWTRITPDRSPPRGRVRQPRWPRPPRIAAAHAPAPTRDRPWQSSTRERPAPGERRRRDDWHRADRGGRRRSRHWGGAARWPPEHRRRVGLATRAMSGRPASNQTSLGRFVAPYGIPGGCRATRAAHMPRRWGRAPWRATTLRGPHWADAHTGGADSPERIGNSRRTAGGVVADPPWRCTDG